VHEHIRGLDADTDDPREQPDRRVIACSGCCSSLVRRAASISRIWSMTKRRRAISRRSSARVFGGSATPSAVRRRSRHSGALRKCGLKPRMPRPGQSTLHPVDDADALVDQVLALAVRPLGIFLFKGWDHRRAAMTLLTTQPAEEGARFNSPVSSRTVFARRCSRDTATLVGWIT
jgi:hypothetical protein